MTRQVRNIPLPPVPISCVSEWSSTTRATTWLPLCPDCLAGAHLALPSVTHGPGLKLTWMETNEFWRQAGWGEGRGLDTWSRRDPGEEENDMRARVLKDEPLGDRATGGGAGGTGGSRVQVRGLEGAPVPFWSDGVLSGGPGGAAEVAGLLHLSNEVQHKVTAQQVLPCVASEHGDRPPSSLLVTAPGRGKVSR